MDMIDQDLESSQHDKDDAASDDQLQVQLATHVEDGSEGQVVGEAGQLAIEPSIQYQIRTDTGQGQVTYRVVQVTQNEDGQTQVVAANAFPQGAQVSQAIIQSPYSNGDSPTPDGLGDARFTYVPAVSAAGDGGAQAQSPDTIVNNVAGQFYVMMSPQDALQAGQRSIAPRTGLSPRIEGTRSTRDDRRRATHNEVERRRRDKINNWIVQLSKLVPDCALDITKAGQISKSKGGILAKACDYITELRSANMRMAESVKETERLAVDSDLLQQQCDELKQENGILRAQLLQHGIVPPDMAVAGP